VTREAGTCTEHWHHIQGDSGAKFSSKHFLRESRKKLKRERCAMAIPSTLREDKKYQLSDTRNIGRRVEAKIRGTDTRRRGEGS